MPSPSLNTSPLESVNIVSRIFHKLVIFILDHVWAHPIFNSWLTPLLTKSRKQGTLHINDLYDPPTHLDSSALTDKLESNWFDELKRCPDNPSLIRATLRTIGWKMLFNGFILIPNVSFHNAFSFLNVGLSDNFEVKVEFDCDQIYWEPKFVRRVIRFLIWWHVVINFGRLNKKSSL